MLKQRKTKIKIYKGIPIRYNEATRRYYVHWGKNIFDFPSIKQIKHLIDAVL